MPFTITLDHLPAGVSLTNALEGEDVQVSHTACLTSEDGNTFLSHIEALWNAFDLLGTNPSQVDHCLALIDRNRQAVVYLNELQQIGSIRPKHAVKAGQQVFKDDIATVEELEFCDAAGTPIVIPPEQGLVLIFSVGWRKCLYYDFGVLRDKAPPRSLDMPRAFGSFHQRLLFQEMYSITEDQWTAMFKWGWFPFIWMSADDRKKVINFSTRPKEPRSLFEEICGRFKLGLRERLGSWNQVDLIKPHAEFIEKAADRYLNDDFISAISNLFPRLEGVMRTLHLIRKPGQNATQKTMADNLVADHADHSLLLPPKFREYLTDFYFRAFNQAAGELPFSRHTHGHGVSLPSDYDFIKASLGFMILDQMFYFLGNSKKS